MINVVCGIRSTGRLCTDLAVELKKQGHQVIIAYGRESVPEQYVDFSVRVGTDADVKLHGIKARLLDGCGFGSKRATREFIRWVQEFDPDIIHLHNVHGYYLNLEVLADYLSTCGKRIIWTFHDCWLFTGHTAFCDAIGCTKWENGCGHCPQIKEYPRSFVDRSAKNWQKKRSLLTGIPGMTIVTPSCWMKSLVKQSFLSSFDVTVIHNGIDLSVFSPGSGRFKQVHGLEDRYMLLGVASSWDKYKGLNDFISLSYALPKGYVIVLVGLDRKQLEKLPETIIGIERTNNVQELANLYRSADLFLNLTYCDNYPTVNLEAIACGTEVVTYRTGGSTEIVEEFGGEIVERGDLKELVKLICSKKDAGNRKADTSNIHIEGIDYRVCLKQYLDLYEDRKPQ